MMEFVDAISVRLHEVFGDKYTIYLDSVEQNLQTPCFFIQPIDSADVNMIDNRKHRDYSFTVDYIPEDDTGYRTQFVEVTSKLFDSFDSLVLNDGTIVYTFDRSINVTDDILHFIIRFKFDCLTELPEQPMLNEMTIRNR